mmetsp:Transcript_21142/g.45875  ORF Transcript_21142/g.45875 Transcript_21142/m.45875 type:complete len:873 (+) Transcript_21142:47-2665(+)
MSEESSDEELPLPTLAPAADNANAASASASASGPTPDCIIVDLTLSSDSDDDGDDGAPSPSSATQHHGGSSSYAKFSKYATSLRKRSADDDYDAPTTAVVTPRRRKNKKTRSSNSYCDAPVVKIEVGVVGYKFHKLFFVDEEKKKEKCFHGEVVGILDKAVAKGGKDRRCVYEDGDEEDLSLTELQHLPRCTNNDCPKLPSMESIKKHGPPQGAGLDDESGREVGVGSLKKLPEDDDACDISDTLPKGNANASDQEEESEGEDEDEAMSNPAGEDNSQIRHFFDDSDDDSGEGHFTDFGSNTSSSKNSKGPIQGDGGSDTFSSQDGEGKPDNSVGLQEEQEEANSISNTGNTSGVTAACDASNNEEDTSYPDNNQISQNDHDNDSSDDDKSLFSSQSSDNEDKLPNSDEDDLFPPSGDEDQVHNSDEDDLFSSSGDEEVGDQFKHGLIGNVNYGDSDDDSRFSEELNIRPPKRLVVMKKCKKERAKSLVTEYIVPPEERVEHEYYYLADIWGERMRKRTLGSADGPPPPTILPQSKGGIKYEILYSELITRKGKGFMEDSMGQQYYKSFYLGVSRGRIEKINLKSALLRIGDFESLTYERGAHKTVSRLKLLVSPSCRPPSGDREFCFHRLQENNFELIDDDGHLGCGFIHPDYLFKLLGKSQPARRAFAIQVRIIGPSSVGVAKGVLFVKETIGRETIQIPSSMIKVNKSKTKPLHTYVALNINQHFPSKAQYCMGRLLDDDLKDPTLRMVNDLNAPCEDTQRVLCCKGVDQDIIHTYVERCKGVDEGIIDTYTKKFEKQISVDRAKVSIKHANLVGVSDPTGHIPSGYVFLTGMGNKTPSRVFLTGVRNVLLSFCRVLDTSKFPFCFFVI